METVELVIKMPKDVYEDYWHLGSYELRKIISNGTPLPKGHGALKDADEIRDKIRKDELFYSGDGCEYDFGKYCGLHDARKLVESARTIVEADKEGAEE